MADSRIEALATVLVDYSINVQPGQLIAIAGAAVADPLIRAVYRRVLNRGAHPMVLAIVPGLNEIFYREANDDQLSYIRPDERLIPEVVDGAIRILSESNTKALSGVSPERQQIAQRARAELTRRHLERSARNELNWCVTLFPTNAYAQDAEMSLEDYEDFVFRAALLDQPDPVAAWQARSAEQQRLIDWLSDKSDIQISAPDTDLRLSVGGRTFVNADGRYNFPDGEIFTGPIEDSANGTIRFSFPSMVNGRRVEDIRLRFEDGRVVDASAAHNEEYLHRVLETDQGARFIGELAFGTNPAIDRFTGNILFDEKIGGTVHLAIGASYPETGGTNQSAVHWDMICDLRQQSEVTVDGQPFMRDGRFVV